MRWLLVILSAVTSWAEDWPQFLGPRRDGSYQDEIANVWPKEGPSVVWKKDVGVGWSAPVVSGDKLILFHRLKDLEVIECVSTADGATVWTNAYKATYRDSMGFEDGPRATPAIAGGKVFAYGPDAIVSAIGLSGKLVWRVDAKKEFGSQQDFFGRAASPLVAGDLVLLNVGGSKGAGIVALETVTGKLRWKASDDESSHSSPALAEINGKQMAVFLTRNEAIGIEAANGAVVFRHSHKPGISASVSAATPIVARNLVFVTASYGAGAATLRIESDGKIQQLWASDDALSAHYATPVHQDGLLFGFHGRQEQGPDFVCVEMATGKTRWKKENFGAGTVMVAGEKLLILLESGELVMASANGGAYKELARAQILGSNRAHPALADGYLYARDKSKLVKVDLRK
jgi:outer membrane protein assembly factor BamB